MGKSRVSCFIDSRVVQRVSSF